MDSLDHLLYWRGIASDYFNYKGDKVQVPLDNRRELLRAMGINTDDESCVNAATYALDVAPWQAWLLPFQVIERHKECCFFVNLAPDELEKCFHYSIQKESGELTKGDFIPATLPEVGDYLHQGVRYSRRVVMCGALPLGYHSLVVSHDEKSQDGSLVVVPEKGYVHPALNGTPPKKAWGFIIQLYTLRSKRNWGIGDFSDLAQLVRYSANYGVDIIGLNPLHVLCTPNEYHCSPYSPSDRRFIEPLYLDVTAIDEYHEGYALDPSLLTALRATDQVDYQAVFAAKHGVLRKLYAQFRADHLSQNTPRAQAFFAFVAKEGDALHEYCLYQVLKNKGMTWSAEGMQFLNPSEQAEIDYYAYLQWQSYNQLAAAQALAREQGMSIGLMRDLAVGANGDGAEVSSRDQLFCKHASVGAPPDPLAEKGQNWGLPPMDPVQMRLTGFAHYIKLLQKNMIACGALRIDHAMALMRLWWCPPGKTADFGAYVYYAFPEMLGLLKLESVRNECLVIGEDMGVVPDEFREAIIQAGIYTNKMFYFEREHDGAFKSTEHYMPAALAMLANHDVPTLRSWWNGTDIELRDRLDLLDSTSPLAELYAARQNDKARVLRWLEKENKRVSAYEDDCVGAPMSHELMADIVATAAKSASRIFVIQLEDVELNDMPVNVPGTSDQYPNWRRKLNTDVDEMFANENNKKLFSRVLQARLS